MIKYRYFFISLFFSFIAYADDCKFSGKVHPEYKTTEVSDLYTQACIWFLNNFDVILDPEIVLNNVYYIKSWDEIVLNYKHLNYENLYGIFYIYKDKHINDIYFNTMEKNVFQKNDIVDKSILYHELIHFFIKAANWYDDEKKLNNIYKNMAIHEGFVYFAQNEYIKRATEGEKGLLDYLISDKEPKGPITKRVINFTESSEVLQMMKYDLYLFNAIYFFKEDTKTKYQNIIKGHYPSQLNHYW